MASELARRRLLHDGSLEPEERVAPLTSGAFYKAFAADYADGGRGSALTAFHRLITKKMIDDQVFTDAEAYIAMGKHFAEQGLPWHDIARLGVALEYERWSKIPGLVLLVALTIHYKDEDVASWARESNEEELSQLRRIYEVLLEVYNRRMRPGLTIDHLAVAVSDLVTGMTINGRIMPETRNVSLILTSMAMASRNSGIYALSPLGRSITTLLSQCE